MRSVTGRPADRTPDGVVVEVFPDLLDRQFDERQRAKTEKVHLEQSDGLAGGSIPLRDHIIAARGLVQRNDGFQWLRRHDHAGGMDPGVSGVVLQSTGLVDDAAHDRVAVAFRDEFGFLFQRRLDGDVEFIGNEIRQSLPFLGGQSAGYGRHP